MVSMRSICGIVLAILVVTSAYVRAVDQPPRILGTWYGQYQVATGDGTHQAEMWLEIFYQANEGGWEVRGHNRWNVLDEPGENIQGADSKGRNFEHYDTVDGTIAKDGKTIEFAEEHRESAIDATLVGPDTMKATFNPDDDSPGFHVTLKRIDTHYQPSNINVLGIDISHHSGEVDWETVKEQGYKFAYVKATEGVDDADPMFEKHWRALREAGMARGAYHFYVTEDDPAEQARFFASRLKGDPGTLPPAVDVELLGHNTEGDLSKTLLVFLRTFEKETGVKPMIYTDSNFWDVHYRPEFSEYLLWVAEYGVRMPRVPFGWKNWVLWQRNENKKIKGVEKGVDVNLLHPEVDFESLKPGGRL